MERFRARVVNTKRHELSDGRAVSGSGHDVGQIIEVEVVDYNHKKKSVLNTNSVIGEILWSVDIKNYIGAQNIERIGVDLNEAVEL